MAAAAAPRILITRLSAVGDCIHTLPVLCALREHFPDAFLAWAVQGGGAQVLRGHRALDRLIEVPRGWLKSPRRIASLRRELRSLQFDVAIDPQGLTKSSTLAWLSGARRRIGFSRPLGREISTWLNNCHVTPSTEHVVDRYLQLLRPLGIEQPAVRFDVPKDTKGQASVGRICRDAGLDGDFAVINPGAGWDSKLWPAERFAEVADHLGSRHRLPSLVVWNGSRELAWAVTIVAGSNGHARLAPRTSLSELAATLRRALLMVSSDTGPLHLAAAVGTPCVGLFGPSRREDTGPYGPGNISLQEFYQAGTSRQRRRAKNLAMQAIRVESVNAACDAVLDQQAQIAEQRDVA